MMRRFAHSGLTLIELLIAISLMALLSILGYKAFGNLLLTRTYLMQSSQQWIATARTYRRFENDVLRFAADRQPDSAQIKRTLQLGKGPAGPWLVLNLVSTRFPASTERITYQVFSDGLIWFSTDGEKSLSSNGSRLLDHDFRVRWQVLLDDGRWLDSWPDNSAAAIQKPRAIDMQVIFPSGEVTHKLVALP